MAVKRRKKATRYLIEGDRPLIVLPELVKEIGLEEAIILQQLHWLLRDKRNGKEIDGERWVFNTYEDWSEQHFPWIKPRTLRRYFTRMEEEGLIVSCQPEGGVSRRKYYRVCL